MQEAIILDTETTGTDDPEIVELAYMGVELLDHGFTASSVTCGRYENRSSMTFGALATHHIISEDLHGLPTFDHRFNTPSAAYYVGHNIDFDWKALGEPPVRRICTLAMARVVFPTCDSHSLGALLYFLHPDEHRYIRDLLRNAHSATEDIHLCFLVLEKIRSKLQFKSWQQIWEFSEECRIPRIMTFGKFKDKPISDVDNGWRGWYRKQPNPDLYLLEAFDRYPHQKGVAK